MNREREPLVSSTRGLLLEAPPRKVGAVFLIGEGNPPMNKAKRHRMTAMSLLFLLAMTCVWAVPVERNESLSEDGEKLIGGLWLLARERTRELLGMVEPAKLVLVVEVLEALLKAGAVSRADSNFEKVTGG